MSIRAEALTPASAAAAAPPEQASARPAMRVGFIVGPTGAGKSAFALALAERIGAEIVNADSRQVYTGMDLGTAKPTAAERARVRHHLLDIRTPDQPLDAAEFARRARRANSEIAARGCPVLVVGGSGLYVRVLRDGIFPGPAAEPALRLKLETYAGQHGTMALHSRLAAVDPAAASRISVNDRMRIVRALEVFHLTGTPLSEHQARHRFGHKPYASLTVGVTMPREVLYATIDQRFQAMIAAGLLDEVRELFARYGNAAAPLATIGYRELAAYIRGDSTLPDAIASAQRASRQLAKRQLTWFRGDPATIWIDGRAALETAYGLFAEFFASGKETDA